jgi:hypothetical protein
MVEVGDQGIVYSAGAAYSQFSPVAPAVVGDKVILIECGGGQQIAVPVLAFELGQYSWAIPEFRFAGFDWKFNWDTQLLSPFVLPWNYTDHDFKAVHSLGTIYGDSPMTPDGGTSVNRTNPPYGDIEYIWEYGIFEDYPKAADGAMCVKFGRASLEIWCLCAPNPDYGAWGAQSFYIKNKLVWSGQIPPAEGGGSPHQVVYHVTGWTP